MLLEVARLGKALAATVAAERPLSGVDPLVGLEVGQAGEGFPADPTYVTPPSTLPWRAVKWGLIAVRIRRGGDHVHAEAGRSVPGGAWCSAPRGLPPKRC